tara:strand:- start:489 stop:749 length:261 start_codon:yes stop_codon:yes gene_type:complete
MTNYKPFADDEKNYLFDMIRAKSKPVISVKDCSLLSSMSVSSIRRAISNGELKAFQLRQRGKILVERNDFFQWLGVEPQSYAGGTL